MFFWCFVLAIAHLFAVVTSQCYDGWIKNDNKCYFFSRDETTWIQASNFCKGDGGYLAEARTDSDHRFLLYHIVHEHDVSYWIGGSDMYREGSWVWMSDHTPINDTHWNHGEPNNSQGLEDCMLLNFQRDRRWTDFECSKQANFICQKNLNIVTPEPEAIWIPVHN